MKCFTLHEATFYLSFTVVEITTFTSYPYVTQYSTALPTFKYSMRQIHMATNLSTSLMLFQYSSIKYDGANF